MALGRSRRRGCVLLLLGRVPGAARWTCGPGAPLRGRPAAEAAVRARRTQSAWRRGRTTGDSEENRFRYFPFRRTPVGQTPVFEETVDAGAHVRVLGRHPVRRRRPGGPLHDAIGKLDLIDLYDRNPTSTGQKVDIDEAWIRFGREPETATLAPGSGVYLKLGKIAKFERQNDRHLQSYGLVSTAFNRFEETGGELGVHLGRHFYLKAAGRRRQPGLPARSQRARRRQRHAGAPAARPRPATSRAASPSSTTPTTPTSTSTASSRPAWGSAGAWRTRGGATASTCWPGGTSASSRTRVEIHGSFYGGDLDILNGPEAGVPADVTYRDHERREAGGRWQRLALPGGLLLLRPVRGPGPRRPAAHGAGGGGRLALRPAARLGGRAAASSSPRSRRPCATRSSTTASTTPS